MNAEAFLARVDGVRQVAGGWQAHCPCKENHKHEDRKPSLSIREADGRILVHCHVGCTVQAIVAALGLKMADLFAHSEPQKSRVQTYEYSGEEYRFADLTPGSKIINVYDYLDEQSGLLYRVCRFDPKDFRPCRPDGRGGWVAGLGNVRRVLYNLPAVLAADLVLVVEGERDAQTARQRRICPRNSNPASAARRQLRAGERNAGDDL